jgi:hypothetical protein
VLGLLNLLVEGDGGLAQVQMAPLESEGLTGA